MKFIFAYLILLTCSSCAIGSATAGISAVSIYAGNAGEARRLTRESEELLSIKIKEKVLKELMEREE